jgi:hypothetical protein
MYWFPWFETDIDAVCIAVECVGLLEMHKEDSCLLECDAVLLGSSTGRIHSSWTEDGGTMIVPNTGNY